MKKITTLLVPLLAANFVVVLLLLGYLAGTGHLDREKIANVRAALFPPTSQPTTEPTTEPAADPDAPKPPLAQLEEMLAKQSGRPATEQLDYLRHAFDEQMGQLDRRAREIDDQRRQVEAARAQVALDRQALDAREKALDSREADAAAKEKDDGFQKELDLYVTLPAPQLKKLLLAMDDDVAAKYLTALPPRVASKVLKECQSAEDTARVQAIMEKVRKSGQGGALTPNQPASVGAESAPSAR
jgi:hypothetical protein